MLDFAGDIQAPSGTPWQRLPPGAELVSSVGAALCLVLPPTQPSVPRGVHFQPQRDSALPNFLVL